MNVTVPYTRIRAHNTKIQSVTMQSNMAEVLHASTHYTTAKAISLR